MLGRRSPIHPRVYALYYSDIIMGAMASQITSLTIVYLTIHSDADQRKHQSSASLAFVWGFHRWPVNSPHKGPVTRKMFPFDDIIMWFVLCCVLLWFGTSHLPISFMVNSLALWQSHDCPSAIESTLKNMGKCIPLIRITLWYNQKKGATEPCVYFAGHIICWYGSITMIT